MRRARSNAGLSKYERWNYADVGELADLKKGRIVEEDGFDKPHFYFL